MILTTFVGREARKPNIALYAPGTMGNVTIAGRESPCSLYDPAQSSMDIAGGYDQRDAKGFIRINALRLINAALRKSKK